MGQIVAIPQQIQDIGRKAVGLAQEITGIISAGSSYLQLAGSGNQGFLTTPAMAALTVAQIAALKNLGGLMDQHGQDLGGAASVYATTESSVVTAATPTDGSMPSTTMPRALTSPDGSTPPTGTVPPGTSTPDGATPGTTSRGVPTPGTTIPGTAPGTTATPGTPTPTTTPTGRTRAV